VAQVEEVVQVCLLALGFFFLFFRGKAMKNMKQMGLCFYVLGGLFGSIRFFWDIISAVYGVLDWCF
jgi:hypothetical protein